MTVDERWNVVTSKNICFSCLYSGHSIKTCKFKQSCDIDGCKRLHHKLLHPCNSSQQSTEDINSVKEINKTNLYIQTSNEALLKIIPVLITKEQFKHNVDTEM